MLDAGRHLADLARFAVRRKAQERLDRQVLAELERRPLDLPAGLEIAWLGVAGFRLTFEGHSLVVDPYLSRITLRRFLGGAPALPDRSVAARLFGGREVVDGVIAGHTHFDHALDVPAVVRVAGCRAYGSRSLARLMAAHGMAAAAVVAEPFRRYELGPFAVTFVPSAHARIVLGRRVPMDGEIVAREARSLSARAYRCGQVWAFAIEVGGVRLYHQGSADLVDEAVPRSGADVFLAGVAGREYTRDYWARVLRRLRPDVVVPCHHDDFFAPLNASFALGPNVRVARVPEEVQAVAQGIDVVALPREPWPDGQSEKE